MRGINTLNRWLHPWVIVLLLALLYALIVVAVKGSPLALVTVGSRFSTEGYTYSDEGYDGQFVYFIARDPSGAAALIERGGDLAAYRYQRILLPALGWLLSLGEQAVLVPWALLLINLVALAGGTWALQQILHDQRISQWYALGYGLSLPALAATRLSLTEPLAYGLAVGGLLLANRSTTHATTRTATRNPGVMPWLASALLFALAALAKETTLIMAAGVGLYLLYAVYTRAGTDEPGKSERIPVWLPVVFGVITLTPFILWQIILKLQFGTYGIGSGGRLATPFEIIPFNGVIQILTVGGVSIFLVLLAILLPFVLLPAVWGLVWVVQDLRHRQISLLTCVLLTCTAIMPFVPFSTYREPLGILRFIAGLQIAVIAYAAERRAGRPLCWSILWALTTLFVLTSDFSAGK